MPSTVESTNKNEKIRRLLFKEFLWEQVCDFSGWNAEIVKQLAIKTLPANILLNPFGKIEGKDMTEEAIKKKLKEIENTEKEKQQNKSKR